MTIASGTKLGRYEIRSKIGEGGMGEVYRARDEKLNRDVAIKVLPAALSENSDRLHRFEQEAQAAGVLNHPNILAVYDVGTHDGAPYVVSELLEGETLRGRLDDGPLSTRKAIDYATQVARGLAAAHDRGIIHRDLKPDNLFITKDDRVKILDFGLAKLVQPSGEAVGQTDIATRKVHTDPGTVMGTVGYMSPEQVRGQTVDHRTDIFSFGTVLYEMLSGRRAFRGDSVIETLNAILKEEPAELANTNPNIAPALERVVWHCLEKSPERRFQSASDVAFALESLSGVTSHPSQQTLAGLSALPSARIFTRERLMWLGVCVVLLIVGLAFAIAYFSRSTTTTAGAVRLSLATPEKAILPRHITVSPDGARVAFVAGSPEGKRLLWVRPLDSLTAQPLAGTDGASAPFWSPDSRFVGYFANAKLYKVDASGGRPQALCDVREDRGGAWNGDGVILFGDPAGLYRVSAQGGTPVLATKIDPKEEAHRWPYFLPDGRHFVFLADAQTTENHHIRLGSLESQDTQILFGAISRVAYAPPGYLLYVSQSALVAQPFDARTLKVSGDPITVAEHVADMGPNHEFDFSVSNAGALAYQSGSAKSQFVWFDRAGKNLGAAGEPDSYASIALSPDAQRAAVGLLDADLRVSDIWILDWSRGKSRLTFDPRSDGDPLWSPDGTQIVFTSNRKGDGHDHLYITSATAAGNDQPLLASGENDDYGTSWSRDGQSILLDRSSQGHTSVWLLPLSGDRQPKPLMQSTAFDEASAKFSPDGRFVAYVSNESGRHEIYVQPFPPSGAKWQVSYGGGVYPLWRGDGKELFYMTNDGKVMSAQVNSEAPFQPAAPQQLFQSNVKFVPGRPYAVSPDGQRFLINTPAEANNPAPMIIVLNWTATLKQKQ
jgi:Tol biopolymer transport system component/tRNA A-37 threonylcarbamoyl transferase component Bud32